MSCGDLKPIDHPVCGDHMPREGKFTLLNQSGCVFDEMGNLIGLANLPIEGKQISVRMIVEPNFEAVVMSVSEYALILGKSVSWATKHIREGNSLPYVLKVNRKPNSRQYELTVSAKIKLKTPLK